MLSASNTCCIVANRDAALLQHGSLFFELHDDLIVVEDCMDLFVKLKLGNLLY